MPKWLMASTLLMKWDRRSFLFGKSTPLLWEVSMKTRSLPGQNYCNKERLSEFMTLQTFLLVGLIGLAGAGGALARYLLGRAIAERTKSIFPWGTLLINVSGAFFIGLLFGLTSRKAINTQAQTILATGFLGGYTTFSTMSWEGVQLIKGGNSRLSALYLAANFVPGLLAAALGIALGGLF